MKSITLDFEKFTTTESKNIMNIKLKYIRKIYIKIVGLIINNNQLISKNAYQESKIYVPHDTTTEKLLAF